MENKQKLERTLCGMLPYWLQIKTGNSIRTMVSQMPNEYFSNGGSTNKEIAINNVLNRFGHLPLLHSMDKLTKPILEGGLIPIVELAKMSWANIDWEVGKDCAKNEVHGCHFILHKLDSSFSCGDGKHWAVNNQLELFEKLKEWHFNLYGLPKEQYIEKSTLT